MPLHAKVNITPVPEVQALQAAKLGVKLTVAVSTTPMPVGSSPLAAVGCGALR